MGVHVKSLVHKGISYLIGVWFIIIRIRGIMGRCIYFICRLLGLFFGQSRTA
jgi:hypothetical protein